MALIVASAGWAPAGAAAAVTPPVAVRISRVQYDSPGADTRTNASVNGEYVVLSNPGPVAVQLQGYTVRDATGHTFTFTTAFTLTTRASVAIHSGKGTNTTANRYWGLSTYVWNNGGDAASLRDARSHLLATCSWKTVAPGSVKC